jgi:hypothetical protein
VACYNVLLIIRGDFINKEIYLIVYVYGEVVSIVTCIWGTSPLSVQLRTIEINGLESGVGQSVQRIILQMIRITGGISKDENRITAKLAPASTAIRAITLAAIV